MTALAFATRPAFPLGEPVDRDRYGMTPEHARLYRWLVRHKPHAGAFAINTRASGPELGQGFVSLHRHVQQLVDRGWLRRDDAGYAFVHPVMVFNSSKGI